MAKMLNYVLIFLCLLILDISSAAKCETHDPCYCEIDKYTFINLHQVKPPSKTFFQDGQVDVAYFFSGCENKDFHPIDYSLDSTVEIKDVSLVKCNLTDTKNSSEGSQTCKAIGYAKDIQFDLIPSTTDQYQIIYSNNKSSNESSPTIRLACGTFNSTDLKIFSSATDVLTLYSPLVCIQHTAHHELSSGSIFCIIFFVAAIIYFIGGALIMYFVRGARGVEVIPNFDFWVAIPGLIKDGLVYILSGCRPFTVSSAETYDRI